MGRRRLRGYRGSDGKSIRASTNVYICKEHYLKQILHCRNHRALVCEKCLPTYHRNCDLVEVHSAVQSIKPSLLEFKRAAQLTERRFEQSIATFHDDVEKSLIELDDMECRIINMFAKMKRKLRATGSENMDAMKNELEKLKNMTAEIETLDELENKNGITSVLNKADDMKLLEQRLSVLNDKHIFLKLDIKYRREILEVIRGDQDNGIGTIVVHKSRASSKYNELDLELVKSVRATKQKEEIGIPQYVGITFLSKDRMIVLDDHNRSCKVLGPGLRIQSTYPLAYAPIGVAAISDNEVAVTSGVQYFIDVFHLSDRNELILRTRFPVTSCYDSVCQISGHRLTLTTFADRRPIHVMLPDGEEKDNIISFPKKSMQLGGAYVAYMPQLDNLVYADRFDNSIVFYNIRDETRRVIKDATFDGPRGVCVAPSGYVYVCNQNAHSIVEISPSGKVVTHFKLRIKYPRTVAINSDGTKLVVSNGIIHSGRIQIYNMK